MENDEYYMAAALDAARAAAAQQEVPIGAILVNATGDIIAKAGNTTRMCHDPAGHAEINVLRKAGEILGNHRLLETTLFVTLEPCAMCAGAISHARVKKLVIAAEDPKGGAIWHGPNFFQQKTCHWRPDVERGPFGREAGLLLQNFFRARRKGQKPTGRSALD